MSSSFERRALALRYEFVRKTDTGLRVLDLNPGLGELIDLNTPDEISSTALEAMWSPFFASAIVHIVEGVAPTAFYYNPLLDVAFVTRWTSKGGDDYRISGIRTVAGERISGFDAAIPLFPSWMGGEDSVEAFVDTASRRLDTMPAFADRWKPDADDAYRAAVNDFKDVQKRLVWNVNHRAQWAQNVWLPSTLTSIQDVLNTNDATVLRAAAPDTTELAADTLASLPQGFAEHLVLDMILEDNGRSRILIGSREDEGRFYIWVICRVAGETCLLSRIGIVSI